MLTFHTILILFFPGYSGGSYFQYVNDRAHTIGTVTWAPLDLEPAVKMATRVPEYMDWIKENIDT